MCMSMDRWDGEVQWNGGCVVLYCLDLNTIPVPVYSPAALPVGPANCTETVS